MRERVRDYGVLKAIGLTPRQIAASLIGVHAAIAAIAALFSIPAGIGLYFVVFGSPAGTAKTS